MPFNTLYSKQKGYMVSENKISLLDSVIEIKFLNWNFK